MILTPCWPRAGPTGGEGLAFPAGICSLTIACTFFAMSEPLDLVVLELHGGQPSEDGHHDLQLAPLGVEIVDRPLEVHEGPLDHPHLVPFLEGGLELRLLRPFLHLPQDALDLGQRERDGLGPGARVGVYAVPLLGGGAGFAHFRMPPPTRASPTSTAPR